MEYGEETVKRCLPVVARVVKNVFKKYRSLDLDNLYGEACLRLLDVLDGCDLGLLKTASVESYVYCKLRFRLIDFARSEVGRKGQKMRLRNATSIDRLVKIWKKDNWVEMGDILGLSCLEAFPQLDANDAIERLLRSLPAKHADILRTYLTLGEGDRLESIEATRTLMARYGVSESRICMLRKEAIGWLAELGADRVREILFGKDAAA